MARVEWSDKHKAIVDAFAEMEPQERGMVFDELSAHFCQWCYRDDCNGECENDE